MVEHRAFPQLEVGVIEQVTNVLDGAGGEIVESDDEVPARYERVGQMRADEAGTAGDEIVHGGGRDFEADAMGGCPPKQPRGRGIATSGRPPT
jgi:hypothetical protein